ncbi:MAG TPA: MOSC and FAD-binding oxidoreductase domain-containing protein [Burkholderiaceae bacterium]|nr:MOSC and FAD-binding oxidoreductase domain-containing protein [Burkholderiaceae bacterium]
MHTAIWKDPVQGRCRVKRLNVEGDGQGDLGGHGGEQRAVFVYQIESYRYWEERLGRSDFTHGQFGENFTIEGLPDDEVCIGDRYRIGTALFEVTQPRTTCYRVGIRMDEPQMAALLTSSGHPGFYLRVLEEGEVGAGDPILLITRGPQRMTVAQVNALLYSSHHPRDQLERVLRIPALSPGWRWSFEALVRSQDAHPGATGNAGLVPAAAAQTAAPGFRPLRVSRIDRECADVISLSLQPTDGRQLTIPLAGQFVVLRLRPKPDGPALFRSYSLSGPLSDEQYRVSVKVEPNGAAGSYLNGNVRTGDILDVSEPRGSFTLQPGDGPVVLLSAGIGATPVLAMLHALVASATPRAVWWLHGARDSKSHSFATEVRQLLGRLARGRSQIWYSRPAADDRQGREYDATGRLGIEVLDRLGVPRGGDFYICGPSGFLGDLRTGLAAWGVPADRIHAELFSGGPSLTPGVISMAARAPHPPAGTPGTGALVSFARSGIAARWRLDDRSLLELAEACDVPVRWSCRTGVCHNCESGLISGSVTYEPDPLDPPAQANVLICCSRPQGDVVIDI